MKKAIWFASLAALVTVVFALPAPAGAANLKHRGTLADAPSATVEFAVKAKKRNRKLVRINGMTVTGLPVTCTDGVAGAIDIEAKTMRVRGKRFSRQGTLLGVENGTLAVSGRLQGRGKRAKGEVTVTFQAPSGAGCTSGEQGWSTRRR